MATITWTPFIHPHQVYRLEYPNHWEHLEKDDAKSCGFGPKERDDVGLWISILPMSVDTDRLVADLPKVMEQAIPKMEATNLRQDSTLRHYGLKADQTKEGDGGCFWIMAGGDVVLFASTQVPPAERDVWAPLFDRVMASLLITREDALLQRKVAGEVLTKLRELYPEEEFEFDERGIRGKGRMVFLGNVYREVKAAPNRRAEIIKHFVQGLGQSVQEPLGAEVWDDVRGQIVPVIKPKEYITPGTATENLHVNEWLGEVIVVYAIRTKKIFRFVTDWDLRRWEITPDELYARAMANLAALPWPEKLAGSRMPDGGRVIVVETNDSLASSRLLHPDLHHLFSGPLGSPFWAGIPDRNTLVVFSNRRALKKRIGRQLLKDHRTAGYPITGKPFLVTPDGIAPGGDD
jgi:uncharacterized protein YtpQ (UPF0354 family)